MIKTIATTAALAALALAPTAQAQDMSKLAADKGCLACHQADKKLVGPSYKEVAAKYRTDKEAMGKLVKKVREGSNGVWGPVPMPPNQAVSEKDAAVLVKWILSQK
jgi:cytochrome c